jgi:hypothetical protein
LHQQLVALGERRMQKPKWARVGVCPRCEKVAPMEAFINWKTQAKAKEKEEVRAAKAARAAAAGK